MTERLPPVRREVLDQKVLTFEERIGELWRICYREVFGEVPDHIRRDSAAEGIEGISLNDVAFDLGCEEHTRDWYARAILTSIVAVRLALDDRDASRAASEAVVLGSLATAAEARLSWPEIQRWHDYLKKQSIRSRKGAKAKRFEAARATSQLIARVRALKAQDPERSQREIARRLLVGAGREVTERSVAAMAKRIGRLVPRT